MAGIPKRQTDGSTVIRSQNSDTAKARVFKLNATPRDPVLVERYASFCSKLQSGFLSITKLNLPFDVWLLTATGKVAMNVNTDSIVRDVTWL